MNDIRNLARKLTKAVLVAAIAALLIAMVAIPASAITKMPARPAGVTVLNGPDSAPIPALINYQGYLTDSSGTPINAILGITFAIYDSGGTQLWTETQPSVSVSNGLFNVLLGSVNPINVGSLGGESYLGVQVGADAEMTPRQRLVSVAYALRAAMANNADTLDGQEAAAFAPVAHTHPDVYVNTSGDTMIGTLYLPLNGLVAGTNQLVLSGGNVGIGTPSPSYKLHVEGTIYGKSTNSPGVYGESTTHEGVWGIATSGTGVYGRSASGPGVVGVNTGTENQGRLGTSNEGVYGYGGMSSSYGVLGISPSGGGVYGQNSNSGNYGQLGTAGAGVYGYSTSTQGVSGSAISGIGVYGRSTSGNGVRGYSTSGIGGVFVSDGSYGVYGYSTSGIGVAGWGTTFDFYADGTGTDYGPFTGAHEVKLAAAFPKEVRPGMIVSVTGETQVRTDQGQINFSSTLPTVQLAATPNDRAVFGVIISESPLPEGHWYQSGEGERFGIVNALGDGRVWVTNLNGDIQAGDYITTSAIAGYGQKQADDLLHSYTLGKATETVDWSTVTETVTFNGQTWKAYPIAVVYTSG
jgi:hypothetical protein